VVDPEVIQAAVARVLLEVVQAKNPVVQVQVELPQAVPAVPLVAAYSLIHLK